MLKSIRGRLLLQIGLLLLTIVVLLEVIFAAAVSTYYFDSARQIVQSRAVTAATLLSARISALCARFISP